MFTRFAWVIGLLLLLSIGFLMACGSHFSPSSDGLLIVSSQGSVVLQTFSFNLKSGHTASINNPPPTAGLPSNGVIDPTGTFAYFIVHQNSAVQNSTTGIAAYKINSDGTLAAVGSPVAATSPVALSMDSAGKFLFAANGLGASVSIFSIGSGGSLTLVGSSSLSAPPPAPPNFVALAITPTTLPVLAGSCSTGSGTQTPQSAEFLYVVDSANDTVWDFSVDPGTGAVGNPPSQTTIPGFRTGSVPSAVTVDPCNRFVFISNQNSDNVSAYTICNGTATSSTTCSVPDGSLTSVGPAVSAGSAPVAITVDPLGNFVYVVNNLSNTISTYHISAVTGELSSLANVATGASPVSIAIRNDDAWLFVANFNSATVSQYALIPATGALTPQPAITTDNLPFGVAVK